MTNGLTTTERKDHAHDVAIVTKGFIESGQALARIRDNRSYRETHKTFEAFCREVCEFTSNYAKRLIRSSEVAKRIENVPIGTVLPATETQARPLTTIDLEQVGDVWQEVIEKAPKDDDDKPIITAKHVQETVDFWKAADQPYVEEQYDYSKERDLLYDTVRRLLERWPEDHCEAAAQLLRQLAKEATL